MNTVTDVPVPLRREIAQCSASLIGSTRQHVLTAGHCLVNVSAGGAAYEKITFYPALNGNDEPFGSINAQTVCQSCSCNCHWEVMQSVSPQPGRGMAIRYYAVLARRSSL
jgi:hypothetical protein